MENPISSGSKMVEIDLTKLTIPELSLQKQQFHQELALLEESIQTLKIAQTKFQESRKSVEKAKKYSIGKPLLIPLTRSMYVDGEIEDNNSFVINVGTGYYLKKDAGGAKDYFQRRLSYVTTQIDKLQSMGADRSRIKEIIISALQAKIQAQLAQQQQSNNTKEE